MGKQFSAVVLVTSILAASIVLMDLGLSVEAQLPSHGDNCTLGPGEPESTCDPEAFLDCIDSTCQCNETMRWLQVTTQYGGCFLNVGQPCLENVTNIDPKCVIHSHCNEGDDEVEGTRCACVAPDFESEDGTHCIHTANKTGEFCAMDGVTCNPQKHLECNTRNCGCLDGWIANKERYCHAGYNTMCNDNDPDGKCSAEGFLGCNQETRRCGCQSPTTQVYNPVYKVCDIRPGHQCEYNPVDPWSTPMCASYATCSSDGVCECAKSYEPSKDNTSCVPIPTIIEHGEWCVVGSWWNVCDASRQQFCKRDQSTYYGYCECIDGLVVNGEKMCQAGHGSQCVIQGGELNRTCNTDSFLECDREDLKCRCQNPQEQYYKAGVRACEVLVGGECTLNSSKGVMNCTHDSLCKSGGVKNTCACNLGYKASEDLRECVRDPDSNPLNYEEVCVEGDLLNYCNPAKTLVCKNSTCQCEEKFLLHEWKKECQADYGMECNYYPGRANETCNNEYLFRCSSDAGTCTCLENHLYIEERGACAAIVGLICPQEETEDVEQSRCVPNAHCGGEGFYFYCICNSGHERDPTTNFQTCKKSDDVTTTPGASNLLLGSQKNVFVLFCFKLFIIMWIL